MSHLFLRLLDIMRLRSGPQDMPAGWGIATLLSLAYLAESMIADRVLDGEGSWQYRSCWPGAGWAPACPRP
jgi:hypothetical protein